MSDRIIPEVSHPTEACPNPEQWHCYDGEATEVEVLEHLTSLVTLLKPPVLIETGCYRGYGTRALARGILANEKGLLWTCDIGFDMVQATRDMVPWARVNVEHCTGLQLIARLPAPIDFAFLDSGPDEVRCAELRAVLPKMSRSGVIVVHDTGLQHGLRPHFLKTVEELGLQYFMFDTPRGLSLVRKPWQK